MNPLRDFLSANGAQMVPHPATEPAPGGAGVVAVTPSATWVSVDKKRTNTTAAILVAPSLRRPDFMPNVVGTTSIITAAEISADDVLDAVAGCMEVAAGWRVRAQSRLGPSAGAGADSGLVVDGGRTLDVLGEYRLGPQQLAVSALVCVRQVPGACVVFQIYATTFAEQISRHQDALAAMCICPAP